MAAGFCARQGADVTVFRIFADNPAARPTGAAKSGSATSGSARLARSLALLCVVGSSAGCVLTSDLPDPALEVPNGYKAARLATAADAPPTLDWWRGFRSAELTQLMEEAQTVNLDIAAATARFMQADAQARIAGAPLLPNVSGSGSENNNRTSGSSASGLTNGGRETVTYGASLSASYELDFWGRIAMPPRRRKRPRLPTVSTATWWR